MSWAPARLERAGLLGLVAALAQACDPSSGLRIDQVEPASAAPGDPVVLTGYGFCGDRAVAAEGRCPTVTGYVNVGIELPMKRAAVNEWTESRIAVTLPMALPAGATEVVVTVDGRSSNAARLVIR